jgi:hypothetical protein
MPVHFFPIRGAEKGPEHHAMIRIGPIYGGLVSAVHRHKGRHRLKRLREFSSRAKK